MQINRQLVCSQSPDLWFGQILFLHMLFLLYQKETALLAHFLSAIPRYGVDQAPTIHTMVAVSSNPCVLGRHRKINFDRDRGKQTIRPASIGRTCE